MLSEAGLESALKKVVEIVFPCFSLFFPSYGTLQFHTISGKNWFGDWFLLTLVVFCQERRELRGAVRLGRNCSNNQVHVV